MIKNMLKEFREFAVKGNMIAMAVGIIIGAAFTAVVTSLVADIIMPPINFLLSKINLSHLFVVIVPGEGGVWDFASYPAAVAGGAVAMNIGAFLNTLI
ncbi:MAG: large-conductance mechanosensitive channel protein MscL, partial [Elusimicrobiota bacterium]|nr:large-conductance mechanosensitive channel protein MscL [Elusimicrobiota bacterium]